MDEEIRLIRGNDRISALAARPGIAGEVTQISASMAEADRTYAMSLAVVRQAANLTQAELARRMGLPQAALSQLEQPPGLLSTLSSCLQATGCTARMTVRFADGHEATLSLDELG